MGKNASEVLSEADRDPSGRQQPLSNNDLPAAFWDALPDDENADLQAINALKEESTPDDRAEALKVSFLYLQSSHKQQYSVLCTSSSYKKCHLRVSSCSVGNREDCFHCCIRVCGRLEAKRVAWKEEQLSCSHLIIRCSFY